MQEMAPRFSKFSGGCGGGLSKGYKIRFPEPQNAGNGT